MMKNGYTLLELIISIAIISAVVVTGVGVFYRSLYGNSKAGLNISLDGQTRSSLNSIERLLSYSRIVDLDGQTRVDCLASESAKLAGKQLTVSDDYGKTTIYLEDTGDVNRVASNSSYISSPTLNISNILFTWDCGSVFDTVKVDVKANVWSGKAEVYGHQSDFSQTILMRNSGSFIN